MKKVIYLTLLSFFLFSLLIFGQPKANATTNSVAIDSLLEEKIAEGIGSFQVIVTFDGNEEPTLANLNLLERIGITDGISLKSLPMVATIATADQIEDLKNKDGVRSVYLNQKLEYSNADATELTGVDQVRSDEQMTEQNDGIPVTGEGVGVVVNDSGVDGTHQDLLFGENLVQNVLASLNLSNLAPGLLPATYLENVPNTDSNSGHGTHVAGTVGGTGEMSDGKYEGVAPGADLIGYGSGAALSILDALGGFDYAMEHQEEYGVRVITNSWGTSGDFDPNDPINIASKEAYDNGITVLFAAGNEGPAEDTHNPYAKAPWVVSVAAGTKGGELADFSSRGTTDGGGTFEINGETWTWKDQPSITAPGVDIISSRVIAPISSLALDKDLQYIETEYLPYYTTMSGTSMATPHVAGVVALILDANPELTPEEVKNIIQQTATPMSDYEAWEVGAGYVNAYDAVDLAFNEN
ncbi:S8 family serine peptidase [Virgibacillus litoralis]|uniref:Serine protease AprX n=1 Tax=Virgibacillus litoralis TaxID=578221 RepID=A0ABS4H945_9BACI|nr:S8 family serine peptidase [Virgibacillus litoralis]MBP1947424.1 serine protease AprX [Virgibacillus litoralis]